MFNELDELNERIGNDESNLTTRIFETTFLAMLFLTFTWKTHQSELAAFLVQSKIVKRN